MEQLGARDGLLGCQEGMSGEGSGRGGGGAGGFQTYTSTLPLGP